MTDTHDHPSVIAPPPLIYVGGLVVGFVLHRLFPVALLPPALNTLIGVVLVVLSAVPGPLALREMHRYRTSPLPHAPSTSLVTTGVFAYTRNPIYLTFTLFYAGIAALVNSLMIVLLLPVVLVVMSVGVIAREERYLDRTFGDTYRQYTARVRRWL